MLRRIVWEGMKAVAPAWISRFVPGLEANGWLRSWREQTCIARDGRPLPWITFPAIEFLARRVRPDFDVFEYGCGASTLWWASRVRSIVSVEHDARWAADISARAPANAKVLHVPLEPAGPYERASAEQGRTFDVCVIDGRSRVACTPHAIGSLNARGVILLDNTDRAEYAKAFEQLATAGFRRVEFVGLAPMVGFDSETSLFYRPGNCLGL